jgi:hypothetical protein
MKPAWAFASALSCASALLLGCGGNDDGESGSGGSAGSNSSNGGSSSGGKSSGSGGSSSGGKNGGGSSSGGSSSGGSSSGGSSSGGSGGADGSGPFGGSFRYGINSGFPNPSWNDEILSQLAVDSGCNSQRVSLPERHLEQWGYEIELADMEHYASLGLDGQVAFLTSPTREHSSAPESAADWELDYYIPKNLYEPITLDDGSINPENYWAAYVFGAVSTYKDHVKIWEIWNEPDWVSDWQVTLDWNESAPTAEDLPRFNGSIYDYVRLLRVSSVAAKLADPEALIATGGLGYTSFLNALLRYTDNPADGSVTDEYPEKGGAYVDVLSSHHYPIYTAGSSDEAVAAYLEQQRAFQAELDQAGVEVKAWETTESGAPHAVIDTFPGGTEYAVNYLMKVMIKAHAAGVDGIDWFTLSDGASVSEADDPYQLMGLYLDVSELGTIDEAVPTETGVAYRTLGGLLGHARYDEAATEALGLPAGVDGAAFETADGKRALALWAVTAGTEEGAAEIELDGAFTQYDWDYSVSGETAMIPEGEPLPLEGAVRVFVEE